VSLLYTIFQRVHLRLFGDEKTIDLRSLERPKGDVPAIFRDYCLDKGAKLICPKDFGQMQIGWYLNHSKSPNTYRDDDYKWYASREIKVGDEITIDYNSLEEPSEAKKEYYNQ
jgi:hypothetical protein